MELPRTVADQAELFPDGINAPEGFRYQAEFISTHEERELTDTIAQLALSEVKMHGVVAKRRTVHFGQSYDFQTFRLTPTLEIPPFLRPLRNRAADFVGVTSTEFGEALITEYQPGAGIGWHRDAPQFGIVVGISLLADCTMQFRPWPHVTRGDAKTNPKTKRKEQRLARRSGYVLSGNVRQNWQHRIPASENLRYSITFRTLRGTR
ncbi:MAG: alpha-ketoglutarate-dependent dioxygenase AlkB [Chthoniobacterales bacterium]